LRYFLRYCGTVVWPSKNHRQMHFIMETIPSLVPHSRSVYLFQTPKYLNDTILLLPSCRLFFLLWLSLSRFACDEFLIALIRRVRFCERIILGVMGGSNDDRWWFLHLAGHFRAA
jgi:hypothetical protein